MQLKFIKFIDKIFCLLKCNVKNPNELLDKNIKNIIIFENYMIGDFFMNLPSIYYLKKIFPDSHLSVVTNKSVYRLASKLEYIDNVVAINSPWIYNESYKELYSFVRKHMNKYDLAIDLQGDIRNTFFLKLLKPRYLLSDAQRGGKFFLTHYANVNKYVEHYSENSFNIVNNIKRNNLRVGKYLLPFLLKEKSSNINKKYIAIHPLASKEERMLSFEFWSNIIDFLKKQNNNLLLVSHDKNIDIIKKLSDYFNINVVTKDLYELSKFINNNVYFSINLDSMFAHLSSLLELHNITFILNDHPTYIRPYNKKARYILGRKIEYDEEGFIISDIKSKKINEKYLYNRFVEEYNTIMKDIKCAE